MKKISLSLFLLATSVAGLAAECPDTLINVANVDTLHVIDNNDHSTLRFIGVNAGAEPRGVRDFQTRVSMPSENRPKLTTSTFSIHIHTDFLINGFYFGGISAFDLPTQFGKSIEVGWLNTLAYSWTAGASRFSIGLGLNWRNYRMTGGDLRWDVDHQGNAIIAPLSEGETLRFSRLKAFSLTLPMMWKLNMPFGLCSTRQFISAGAELNFMTHASVLTHLTDAEGQSRKFSESGINHRPVTANFVAILGLRSNFGLYVRYSPFHILESPSPQFTSLSAGLLLFY